MRVLITGAAGFIGYHLAERLLAGGWEVDGLDALTPYYDVTLKAARWKRLQARETFRAFETDLADSAAINAILRERRPEVIVHLAAQAGVRYSLENPQAYVASNLVGAFNLLEASRSIAVRHLLAASTSSVYGADARLPFVETDAADHPLTLYAATKKANEAMTHAYSHLWGAPSTLIRFFTVYGPWGRPDMALFTFVERMLADRPIEVFGDGRQMRDFTYIDDLVEALTRLIDHPPEVGRPVSGVPDTLSPSAPWRVVNVGAGAPVDLLAFIAAIETALGRKAVVNLLPPQPGDAPRTGADTRLLEALTGFRPRTTIQEGVAAFCAWYKAYHGLN